MLHRLLTLYVSFSSLLLEGLVSTLDDLDCGERGSRMFVSLEAIERIVITFHGLNQIFRDPAAEIVAVAQGIPSHRDRGHDYFSIVGSELQSILLLLAFIARNDLLGPHHCQLVAFTYSDFAAVVVVPKSFLRLEMPLFWSTLKESDYSMVLSTIEDNCTVAEAKCVNFELSVQVL